MINAKIRQDSDVMSEVRSRYRREYLRVVEETVLGGQSVRTRERSPEY